MSDNMEDPVVRARMSQSDNPVIVRKWRDWQEAKARHEAEKKRNKKPVKEDTATGDIAAFTTNRLAPRAKDAPSKNFGIVGAVDNEISYLTKVADRKKPDEEGMDRDHEENKKGKKAKPKKKKTTP
jgi:hypothetical protein